jgi:transcriptional regulator with XRE-family HTH domain
MLKPRLMRAARALAGWEQFDLAEASGISIATVRKIEQGATGTRPRTEARIISAFEEAGLRLIPEGPDGGAGVRWKEPEMNEQMRKYLELRNKIKGWFIYYLGREDNEDLDVMIDEAAFVHMNPGDQSSLKKTLTRWGLSNLPPPLTADLEKLGDMENDIGAQEWMRREEGDEDEEEEQQ